MLETIREFAVERLAELGGVDDAMRQLAEHLLTVAREAEAHARGPDEPAWLVRLELELPNIRVALGWCVERGERALGLELGDALEPLWVRGRQHVEGLRLLESLLELPGEAPPRALAGSLAAAGRCALELGDVERGRALSAQAERIASRGRRRRAPRLGAARAGRRRGAHRGHRRGAGVLPAERGAVRPPGHARTGRGARELPRGAGACRGHLGEAREAYERSVRSYEEAGDARGVAGSLQGLGDVALDVGDAETALAHYRAASTGCLRRNDPSTCSTSWAASRPSPRSPAARARRRSCGAPSSGSRPISTIRWLRRPGVPYEALLGELDPRLVAAGRRLSAEQAAALARTL
jgi:hypothetical protein